MNFKDYFGDIVRMPLLSIGIIIISAIGIFLDSPLIIPVFSASLFMILTAEESELTKVKNIVLAHIIAFLIAGFAPFLLSSLGITLNKVFVIGILVFIIGLLLSITRFQHPPAIAATLVFFEVERSTTTLSGFIPGNIIIAFAAALFIITIAALYMNKKRI